MVAFVMLRVWRFSVYAAAPWRADFRVLRLQLADVARFPEPQDGSWIS